MASQTSDRQQQIHRRVQKRIVGKYLDQLDPDGILKTEYDGDRLTEFRQLDEETKKKFDSQNSRFRKIESAYSIQNICWLIASFGVFYYTDFYRAILYDHRINSLTHYPIVTHFYALANRVDPDQTAPVEIVAKLWFNIGAVLMGVNISIAMFFILYLSYIKRLSSDEWERKYPALIPLATAAFIIGGIFLTMGLWPVWGPFTPLILFVFFMGFVVTVAMLPNF